MPQGKPISLQAASELFWEKSYELWEKAEPTAAGMKLHAQHIDMGIVNYIHSLGYHIVLSGSEYDLAA